MPSAQQNTAVKGANTFILKKSLTEKKVRWKIYVYKIKCKHN